ncbi:HAMP domain-containing histidine kinase [Candidatus Sulfurimonas marisnigri]|uniref:histidine kinase n=1 Tax=Candidatus Sulfurimonas marisnigri TaxID=2740405 RepID=A0A7S7M1W3_9BACT|nr:HAMP domain-containing sensor histidine kinase [Candidatus Sulfurimonas marisnigri]QOY55400.1 HAMP domain-containing histidine kinase [Candidatus Sulfurimonas marisnigri]
MFSKKSIRRVFLIKLIFSLASLILIFSSFLYLYIESSILEEKYQEIVKHAKNIAHNKSLHNSVTPLVPELYLGLEVEIVQLKKSYIEEDLYQTSKRGKTYLTLIYPFNLDDLSYLKITNNITETRELLDKILHYIFIINIAGFLLAVVYAITLSKMLVSPVKALSNKLSNMNEHLIRPIVTENLPEEFESLGATINHLILRIQNFVKYQKELFIGTAHELKTPLAVIKLKNQVTLLKKRSPEEYIEALKVTNKTIDEMNNIVSNILNIGRQEGMQLEKPQEVDVIAVLSQKADDFRLLAENEGKLLEMNFMPNGFTAILQVGLLNQIVQNFLQNALKFTRTEGKVKLQSSLNNYGLLIEVIDEGCGVDESVDLYAPFARQGNKQGVGLGLFLAKSAADALGAKISIKNRTDGIDGTIASLNLNSKLSCILPQY